MTPASIQKGGRKRTQVVRVDTELPARVRSALEEYLFHLSLVRAVSERTVAAYGSDLHGLFRRLAELGVRDPEQVTTGHLREYLVHLGEARGRERTTVARARSAIRSFFAFLSDERREHWQGAPWEDPAVDLPAPRAWRRVPRALSEEEAARLVESIAGSSPLDLRDRAMLEVAYGTGVRVSELLGLTLDDCLWDEGFEPDGAAAVSQARQPGSATSLSQARQPAARGSCLLRITGKGRRTRIVPAGRPAALALRAYTESARPALLARGRRVHEPAAVFLNARGGSLSRMGFWKILRQRALAAGLGEGVHPHLLRHTYATHLLRAGASLRVVQELLGHARLATTQIYTSVDERYLQGMHRRYHPRG
jgi:integrase/recombinase XerD